MLAENIFHGTYRDRGNKIIENKRMELTLGDSHWLGNGSYFFVEEFYAYKWITDMYLKRFSGNFTNESLLNQYMILLAKLKINCRILDLTKAQHKILYDEVFRELNSKKEYSSRFQNKEIAEGVVINYMFNILSFINDFDIVRAIFVLNKKKYENVPSRIGFMPQEQICIKNLEIVSEINEYSFVEHISTYQYLMKNMYFVNNSSSNGYKDNERSYYRSKSPKAYKKTKKADI